MFFRISNSSFIYYYKNRQNLFGAIFDDDLTWPKQNGNFCFEFNLTSN